MRSSGYSGAERVLRHDTAILLPVVQVFRIQDADSGAIGPRFRWEVVQFFEVTGMVDHLPECWTTWTGTVDQITGIGQ